MFSFLSLRKKNAAAEASTHATVTQRMSFEERKAFRREMLYQSLRETFLSMGIIGSMYKFKVMPVDERHHRFVAMFDVAKSFVTGKDARTKSFAQMEQLMRTNAFKRYGVVLVGTYWRVSDWEHQFEQGTRDSDETATNQAIRSETPRQIDTRAQEQAPTSAARALARHGFDAVSEDEAKAFMEAIEKGLAPPVVRIGDQEYQSDLAPLDGGIMIGGTQYGRL